MKNVNDYQLKKCIFLTNEEFGRIIHDSFKDIVIEYSLDGFTIYKGDEDVVNTEELHKVLEEYFDVEKITSIHIDDCDYPIDVWIVYKD